MKLNDANQITSLVLRLNSNRVLEIVSDTGSCNEVVPVRCFPWSQQTQYISLRDMNDKEIVLIKQLEQLPPESQKALMKVLAQLDFVFVITRIVAIEQAFEIRNWQVETLQGDYRFQTKVDEWPLIMPNDQILIEDVSANLFKVNNIKSLDKKSQTLLWPFLD